MKSNEEAALAPRNDPSVFLYGCSITGNATALVAGIQYRFESCPELPALGSLKVRQRRQPCIAFGFESQQLYRVTRGYAYEVERILNNGRPIPCPGATELGR